MDPRTALIQGDLSRNDVIELIQRCRGKTVVEFGMGGSTLLLARAAAALFSYDTDPAWLQRTQRRLAQIPDKTCDPQLVLAPEVPDKIPRCDVLFVDGRDVQRPEWVRRFAPMCSVLIIHDSRSPVIFKPVFAQLAEHFLQLGRIECHAGESNMIIVEMRREPLHYVNWNEAEAGDNRVPASIEDYVRDPSV